MAQVLPDLSYGRDPRHKLDLYLPDNARDARLFFFVHGGGWRRGDKSFYRPLAQVLVNFGYAVAMPNHRFAPHHLHPAHVQDVAAAIGMLAKRSDEFGIRMTGICFAGHSSGAHLVSLVTLHPGYLGDVGLAMRQVAGVVAISGVYDITGAGQHAAYGTYKDFVGEYLAEAFGPHDERAYRDASPIVHARAGAPPFFLAYAEHDYPGAKEQADRFADALKKHGTRVKVVRVAGRDHVTILSGVRSMFDPLAIGLGLFLRSIR